MLNYLILIYNIYIIYKYSVLSAQIKNIKTSTVNNQHVKFRCRQFPFYPNEFLAKLTRKLGFKNVRLWRNNFEISWKCSTFALWFERDTPECWQREGQSLKEKRHITMSEKAHLSQRKGLSLQSTKTITKTKTKTKKQQN